jgi:hypothetical protein
MGRICKLRIGEITARYWLEADEPAREITVPEIFVDEQPLSERMGIERGLAFMNCDFIYDDPEVLRQAIARYTGKEAPFNQFGSGRIVLYRCHCGCDLCGVISFSLVEEGELILWRDLSHETGEGVEDASTIERDYGFKFIEEIAFDKAQYLAEFERYGQMRGLK